MTQRVLFVSAVSRISGAERSLLAFLDALDQAACEPVAALPGAGPLQEELSRLGVQVFHVPVVRPRRSVGPLRLVGGAARDLAGAVALARLARRQRISLIHSNTTAAHLVGGPASALARLPCIWHIRDLQRLGGVRQALVPLTRAAIGISSAVLDRAQVTGGGRMRVEVIPNGIDADRFAARARPGALRRELGISARAPLLAMVAQMAPWKGHGSFLRLVGTLTARHPDLAAVVAGEDLFGEHEGYVRDIRGLTQRLGLDKCVRFLGRRDDVPTLLADADVLVIPSTEGPFGRVALEAMALGTPVVGRARGGLPEVVAHGVTGLLAGGGGDELLTAAVDRLLSDGRLRRELGEAGRARVREAFSVRQHTRRILSLYGEILR